MGTKNITRTDSFSGTKNTRSLQEPRAWQETTLSCWKVGAAQLTEHCCTDTGSIPSAAKDIFPRVSFQCRLSYSVRRALMCSCTHPHLRACWKSQTLAATPLFGHMKILHTLAQMSNASLVLAVALPRYGDLIFQQRILKTLIKKTSSNEHWRSGVYSQKKIPPPSLLLHEFSLSFPVSESTSVCT